MKCPKCAKGFNVRSNVVKCAKCCSVYHVKCIRSTYHEDNFNCDRCTVPVDPTLVPSMFNLLSIYLSICFIFFIPVIYHLYFYLLNILIHKIYLSIYSCIYIFLLNIVISTFRKSKSMPAYPLNKYLNLYIKVGY